MMNPKAPSVEDIEQRAVSERGVADEAPEFVDAADDTPENRAVVRVVEDRLARRSGPDLELDDVIRELGYEPADFEPR